MDVILTFSIKFRLSWDSNTVDCRQVAELDKVLTVRSSKCQIICSKNNYAVRSKQETP